MDITSQNGQLQYCLYARKSSESDERQAMSIDSQIKEMLALAERDGIFIKEIRQESHSAKMSGMRPIFNQLIQDIRIGTFNGILTWAPDRMSRNAGDLGSLVDLMDQGKLLQIRTYGQVFSNAPNDKFLLMILCSQAKLENDNKGINVKRGIRTKCEMGWRPGIAPLGYMNRAFGGVKDIIIDPERAPIIKEMFKRVAYRYHSGQKIKVWMDKVGFTTRTGKRITRSMIYLMLRNPFYYGFFKYGENWYQGTHQPLITKEVFDEVQKELDGEIHRHSGIKKEFPYKGLFTCYSCGTSICGEEKYRKHLNGTVRHHIYYHCTKSRNPNCQEKFITEKDLVKQIKLNVKQLSEDVLNEKLNKNLKQMLMQFEPIVKEIELYANNDYDYDGTVTLKDLVLYASIKSPIAVRKELINHLPIPKKLHNLNLVS